MLRRRSAVLSSPDRGPVSASVERAPLNVQSGPHRDEEIRSFAPHPPPNRRHLLPQTYAPPANDHNDNDNDNEREFIQRVVINKSRTR